MLMWTIGFVMLAQYAYNVVHFFVSATSIQNAKISAD